ncbi:MAG: fumarate hydratase subunit alpha [Candidatus Cloacimonadota bacterium]|nr:fumarate hydratase subunit alpha [Candidatus Cloacimonadota bacterium]
MHLLSSLKIQQAVYRAISEITFNCDPQVHQALSKAMANEHDEIAKDVLNTILTNHSLSPADKIPLCQDTGTTVVFAELGTDLHITDGSLYEAINNAVRQAQQDCPLRASIVNEALFARHNTLDNTPAIIHTEFTAGHALRLVIAQKGGGAENMSFLQMMSPAASSDDIVSYICDGVLAAGSRPCPPLILGIGIGSNFEGVALLAKKAIFEELGRANPDPRYAELEARIKAELNARGCGVQGLGGNNTVLAVHILQAPCHIASLPVAVNLECHAHRHCEVWL